MNEAWDRYATWTDGWIEFRASDGAAAVVATYLELLHNGADPRVGHVCTLTD